MEISDDRQTSKRQVVPRRCVDGLKVAVHFCCGVAGPLACLISALIFFIDLESRCSLALNMVGSLVADWHSDKIYDITSDPNRPLPSSDFYLERWNGVWPGTREDCSCMEFAVSKNKGISREVFRGEKCTTGQLETGCKKVLATSRRNMDKWTNSQQLFAVKAKNTSFLDTYLEIDASGSCKNANFVHCGDKNSRLKRRLRAC